MTNMRKKKREKVIFQGERGAFSEEAVLKLVGRKAEPMACKSFDDLFRQVENKQADYGVIPIENSLVGSVQNNNDLLVERNLTIIGETQLRIVHCLIANQGATMRDVKKIYSHPVALDQCRNFFKKYKSKESLAFYDTAGAVKMLSESGNKGDKNVAAIASPYAAKFYKMNILKESIEDHKFNFTRFILLGRKPKSFTGPAKTSIVFSVADEPGALFKTLAVFALRNINLAKIESRPSRKSAWHYYFYVDLIGSLKDDKIKRALAHLDEVAPFTKVLGCYPQAKA